MTMANDQRQAPGARSPAAEWRDHIEQVAAELTGAVE
jgi:hypothetical protein